MLPAVWRTPLRNRRGAIAEPRRTRFADWVATLAGLRRQWCLKPRRLNLHWGGLGRRLIVRGKISRLHLCIRWREDGFERCGAFGARLCRLAQRFSVQRPMCARTAAAVNHRCALSVSMRCIPHCRAVDAVAVPADTANDAPRRVRPRAGLLRSRGADLRPSSRLGAAIRRSSISAGEAANANRWASVARSRIDPGRGRESVSPDAPPTLTADRSRAGVPSRLHAPAGFPAPWSDGWGAVPALEAAPLRSMTAGSNSGLKQKAGRTVSAARPSKEEMPRARTRGGSSLHGRAGPRHTGSAADANGPAAAAATACPTHTASSRPGGACAMYPARRRSRHPASGGAYKAPVMV
jgi:hypothetical protein